MSVAPCYAIHKKATPRCARLDRLHSLMGPWYLFTLVMTKLIYISLSCFREYWLIFYCVLQCFPLSGNSHTHLGRNPMASVCNTMGQLSHNPSQAHHNTSPNWAPTIGPTHYSQFLLSMSWNTTSHSHKPFCTAPSFRCLHFLWLNSHYACNENWPVCNMTIWP